MKNFMVFYSECPNGTVMTEEEYFWQLTFMTAEDKRAHVVLPIKNESLWAFQCSEKLSSI